MLPLTFVALAVLSLPHFAAAQNSTPVAPDLAAVFKSLNEKVACGKANDKRLLGIAPPISSLGETLQETFQGEPYCGGDKRLLGVAAPISSLGKPSDFDLIKSDSRLIAQVESFANVNRSSGKVIVRRADGEIFAIIMTPIERQGCETIFGNGNVTIHCNSGARPPVTEIRTGDRVVTLGRSAGQITLDGRPMTLFIADAIRLDR